MTNPRLIPAGALRTESKSREEYVERAKEVMGTDEEDIAATGQPGLESAETRFGRVGLEAVEALKNRFLRIEYRVVPKPGRKTKYAIMFFFVLNDKDIHVAVPMSPEHIKALEWFALQTFKGCRMWNNGARIVIDLVYRSPQQSADHHLLWKSTTEFGWTPLAKDTNPQLPPSHPDFLTREYLENQRRREEAMRRVGDRSFRRMFAEVDRVLAVEANS